MATPDTGNEFRIHFRRLMVRRLITHAGSFRERELDPRSPVRFSFVLVCYCVFVCFRDLDAVFPMMIVESGSRSAVRRVLIAR